LTASDGVNAPVSATALVTFVPAQCQKPCISIGDAIGYEGASIALPIVLSTPIPTGQTVSVTATIIPGTAGNCRVTPANCDFTAAAVHNLVFSGAQTKYLTVNANRDKTVEPGDPHTFQIKLSNVMPSAGAGNYTIGKGLGVGSIIDASSIGPNVYLVGRSTIPEMDACTLCKATAKFSVALSSNPAATVSVGYHTVNAGATAGADYTSKSGTLTFSPSTSPTLATLKKFISVVTIGDNVVEPTEGIDVVFNPPPPGYSFAGLPGHIDILDND
jgi:hypothetical protein